MNFILDIDGTLWNTTEIVAKAWNQATRDVGLYEKLGDFITAEMLQHEFGKPMDEIIDDLYPGENPEKQEEILVTVKKRETAAIKKCTPDLAYPGVHDTLKLLYEKGNSLFIVSNCQEGYIDLVSERLGISDYIEDYECFGVTGLPKAKNILLVADRNSLDKNATYYVGDTLGDYRSALAADIPFIFASYGFGSMEKDYSGLSISTFDELLTLFG